MNKKEYITSRIESKLISNIANHRLMVRDLFRKRHNSAFPELGRSQCMHHVNELRVWLKMAYLIDQANLIGVEFENISPVEPYETYYAKQLTK